MRSMRRLLLLLPVLLTACSLPPLPAGQSRIKVTCNGFALRSVAFWVTDPNGNRMGFPKDLGCFFHQEIYFDMPVPPNVYNLIAEDTLVETVQFSGPGETHTVDGWAILVGWTFST